MKLKRTCRHLSKPCSARRIRDSLYREFWGEPVHAALYLGLVGLLAVTTFHVWKLLETH